MRPRDFKNGIRAIGCERATPSIWISTLSPEFNQTVAVQPDGYVTLKGAGTIFVEGQTVPELTETVKAAYAKILHDPVIAIALKDFEKPYFIAAGQVAKPGKYDLRSDLTVTEAVAIAGGFNDKAKHSQVVLFRPLPGGGYRGEAPQCEEAARLARSVRRHSPATWGHAVRAAKRVLEDSPLHSYLKHGRLL